jgi:4-aminobutyrate aminotransferase
MVIKTVPSVLISKNEPETGTSIPGSKAQAIVARDKQVISPSYPRAYPLVMDHGAGSLVWDVDGNRYIDFHAGIAVCSTGHSHPDVVRAIQEQVERFIHISSDFYHPAMVELAEKLTQITPGHFEKRVFLCNSGTEAVETALKLARYTTGRPRVLSFIGSFHGRTMGSLSLTGSKAFYRSGFAPLLPGVTHVPYGYCLRCPINLEYPSCDIGCIGFIEDTLFNRVIPAEEVAAVFVEPIQGEGGYIVPPEGWMQRLRELCDRHGILLVADEVQSGMGRTGRWFAIEHWGVVPDITCIAKGIASGMPLGATVARQDLMDWDPGAHGNTYGGNPVACVAALATIRLIENGYMENAARMGEYIMARLRRMQASHPIIGDVRGLGLMIGVEIIRDPQSFEPDHDLREDIVRRAFHRGLLVLGAGANTIRICPALNIPRNLVDEGLDIMEEAISEAETARR